MKLTIKKTLVYTGFEQYWVCVNGAKVLGPFVSEYLAERKIGEFTKKHAGRITCTR